MVNFILFNGPPRAGKDTAADIGYRYLSNLPMQGTTLCQHLVVRPIWEKFSAPNKRGFAGMMNVFLDKQMNVDYYEKTKEEIIPVLGVSYRQWQIDYSEFYMKPKYGNDIFGRLLVDRCKAQMNNQWKHIFLVSDCGFQIEADTLEKENVLLFTMMRSGTSYDNDSREFISPKPNWIHAQINNNGSMAFLETMVRTNIDEWLRATVE